MKSTNRSEIWLKWYKQYENQQKIEAWVWTWYAADILGALCVESWNQHFKGACDLKPTNKSEDIFFAEKYIDRAPEKLVSDFLPQLLHTLRSGLLVLTLSPPIDWLGSSIYCCLRRSAISLSCVQVTFDSLELKVEFLRSDKCDWKFEQKSSMLCQKGSLVLIIKVVIMFFIILQTVDIQDTWVWIELIGHFNKCWDFKSFRLFER